MIPIQLPDLAERLQLWQNIFPPETPLSENLDFEIFAREAELSGSAIKSAALSAAFRAAAENRPVRADDIALAVNAEYTKIGHMPIFNPIRIQSEML